jgi:23S rRNA pseudouridine1911/1915/1917 synthase
VELPPGQGGETVVPDPEQNLRVLWEDPWLVAVAKSPGLPSHPLRAGERGTVVNALVARYPEMKGIGYSAREPGLLHRLDRDTSGLLLAARSVSAFEQIRSQFEQQRVTKIYLAVVLGQPERAGTVSLPIGSRGRRARKVFVCRDPNPRKSLRGLYPAETFFRLVRSGKQCSLVRLVMRTGVRHQIRAHMGHLGHPVAGDGLYGQGLDVLTGLIPPAPRQLLHAAEIRFFHPDDGRETRIRCPLPDDFRDFVRAHSLSGPSLRA